MSHSPLEYLLHIQTECLFLIQESHSYDLRDFHKDAVRQRAFVRSVEIIGEAVKMLPEDLLVKYPKIKWKQLARMRGKLIHQYFGVDLGIVWNLTIEIIPELNAVVSEMIEKVSLIQ